MNVKEWQEKKEAVRLAAKLSVLGIDDSASLHARISILEQRNETMETALRAIAWGTAGRLREWLTEHEPEAYYPNADTYGLCIHVARAAVVAE